MSGLKKQFIHSYLQNVCVCLVHIALYIFIGHVQGQLVFYSRDEVPGFSRLALIELGGTIFQMYKIVSGKC